VAQKERKFSDFGGDSGLLFTIFCH